MDATGQHEALTYRRSEERSVIALRSIPVFVLIQHDFSQLVGGDESDATTVFANHTAEGAVQRLEQDHRGQQRVLRSNFDQTPNWQPRLEQLQQLRCRFAVESSHGKFQVDRPNATERNLVDGRRFVRRFIDRQFDQSMQPCDFQGGSRCHVGGQWRPVRYGNRPIFDLTVRNGEQSTGKPLLGVEEDTDVVSFVDHSGQLVAAKRQLDHLPRATEQPGRSLVHEPEKQA